MCIKIFISKRKSENSAKRLLWRLLQRSNVILEHLRPFDEGGETTLSNFVLATYKNNKNRGSTPLQECINKDAAKAYLKQFENVYLPNFNGNKYIKMIEETLKKLGIAL